MKLKLGILIPATLALTAVLNVCARFLPPETYTFRAWDALILRRTSLGWFEPDRVYVKDNSYGDLSALGNLPFLREYRQERFTTDACGNRNPGDIFSAGTPNVLLAGDSIMVGSGVEDSMTLSAVLRGRYGLKVYNAAGVNLEPLIAMSRKLGMSSGTVILNYLERKKSPVPDAYAEAWLPGEGDPCARSSGLLDLRTYKDLTLRYRQVSPLQVFAGKALRTLKNDILLPNPEKQNVVIGELRNGEKILFAPDELRQFGAERDSAVPVALCRAYAAGLGAAGLKLTVLLVPDKLNAYSGLLAKPVLPARKGMSYLSRVEKELRREGIGVINLENPFREITASEDRTGRKVYWRDDTHWREAGIEKAAKLVHEYLSRQRTDHKPGR